jgi:hypothetical protein
VAVVETLGEKQARFALSIARFIVQAHAENKGLTVRLGEALRSDEQAEINAIGPDGRARLAAELQNHFPELARKIANNTGSGIRNSLHEIKLAVDVNVFMNGVWQSLGTEPIWAKLARLWESFGDDHCAGYRFKDPNHFSISHEGRK